MWTAIQRQPFVIIFFFIAAVIAVGCFIFVPQPLSAATRGNCSSDPDHEDVKKFSFQFLCPRDVANTDAVTIDGDPDGLDGASPTDYRTIPAGRTINFTASFANNSFARESANATQNREVYFWVTLDTNTTDFGDGANVVVEGNHDLDGYSIQGKSPMSTPSSEDLQGCPGAFGVFALNAYGGADANDNQRSPYAGTGSEVDCGDNVGSDQGRAIWWRLNNSQSNKSPNFRFSMRLAEDAPQNTSRFVCVTPYVSVRFAGEAELANNQKTGDLRALEHIAKRGKRECYTFQKTVITGQIFSSNWQTAGPEATTARGTLRPLQPVDADDRITVSNQCNGNDEKKAPIDATGHYEVMESKGRYFCARAPAEIRAMDNDGQLTTYRLRGAYHRGNNYVGASYENQVAFVDCGDRGRNNTTGWDTDCNGRQATDVPNSDVQVAADGRITDDQYDFIYDPVPRFSNITKTVNGIANGANVVPGQEIEYSVTLENNTDATQRDFTLQDLIPLNMQTDPASVRITQVKYESTLSPGHPQYATRVPPATFGEGSCDNVNRTIVTLYGVNPGFRCSYHANGQNKPINPGMGPTASTTPPVIELRINPIVAYSKLTFTWRGRVKDTDKIGVYPSGTGFCRDANRAHGTNRNLVPECEDKTNTSALQAVTNFARAGINYADTSYPSNFEGWNNSNVITNPIPAEVDCVSKHINGGSRVEFNSGNPGNRNSCDGSSHPSNFLYAPERSDYNSGEFTFQIQRKTGTGPVHYALYDQNNDAGMDSAFTIKPSASSTPLYNNGGGMTGGGVVSWGSATDPNRQFRINNDGISSSTNSANLQFEMNNSRPVEYVVPNYASVCVIKYWEAGHPCERVSSPTVNLQRYAVEKAYLTATRGNVSAGGRVTGGACKDPSTLTSNTSSAAGKAYGNPGSSADYMVTSSTREDARGGGAVVSKYLNAIDGYHIIYRPNLCEAADKASPLSQPNLNVNTANQAGFDGRVVKVSNGTNTARLGNGVGNAKGSKITIDKRWTMYVDGDLYINSDVEYSTNLAPSGPEGVAGNRPSFGVIVSGNIYVHPSVERLDGFYYAGNAINTCVAADGRTLGTNTKPGLEVDECAARLTVNGLFTANTFRLNRTARGGAPAETFNFDNRIYTATPPAFSNLIRASQSSRYLIESLPRY